MPLTKVLVSVKTYPTLSTKYDELVCTAGFLEDGSWIRIYPVPFRQKEKDQQYKKYDWIELNLIRNRSDFRPETYKPHPISTEIKIVGHITPDNFWQERKNVVLKNVYTNISDLIADAKDKNICRSLAVFKPKKITNFKFEKVAANWNPKKLAIVKAGRMQLGFFERNETPPELIKKLPYKFSYEFIDEEAKKCTLMIEDWEIGQLYWNCLKRNEGDESKAIEDVKKKYFDDHALTKDIHLFLGSTREFHNIAPNPFIIVGTFYPGINKQESLF